MAEKKTERKKIQFEWDTGLITEMWEDLAKIYQARGRGQIVKITKKVVKDKESQPKPTAKGKGKGKQEEPKADFEGQEKPKE